MVVGKLDNESTYITFMCPNCKNVNCQDLDSNVHFTFDIDLAVTDTGACTGGLVTTCQFCQHRLLKELTIPGTE